MRVIMPTLVRTKNGDFVSRKAIPADVRDAYTRLYRKRPKAKAGGGPTEPQAWEELFKQPAATSPSAAKVAWAEWLAEIDRRIASLRAEAKGRANRFLGRTRQRWQASGTAGS
jgi:hypothetical protein